MGQLVFFWHNPIYVYGAVGDSELTSEGDGVYGSEAYGGMDLLHHEAACLAAATSFSDVVRLDASMTSHNAFAFLRRRPRAPISVEVNERSRT